MTTVDVFIAANTVQLVVTKLHVLAPKNSTLSSALLLSTLSCTVLCSFLNTRLWQVSLAFGSGNLVGAGDLWWGFCSNVAESSNGSIFWNRSFVTFELLPICYVGRGVLVIEMEGMVVNRGALRISQGELAYYLANFPKSWMKMKRIAPAAGAPPTFQCVDPPLVQGILVLL